jgi:hypothetical protein
MFPCKFPASCQRAMRLVRKMKKYFPQHYQQPAAGFGAMQA